MDLICTSKVSIWIAKGTISLIKAPFIPEASMGKGRWNGCLQEQVVRTEPAATGEQKHAEDLVWKEQGENKHPWGRFLSPCAQETRRAM